MSTFRRARIKRTFYVAPNGSDMNPGTATEPFATIARARDAVRAIASDMRGDVVVKILAGNHFLMSPIELSDQDSGTNGFEVIYESDSGSTTPARVYGGTPVTGWTQYSGDVYQAPVTAGRAFYNLVEDDVMAAPQAAGVRDITRAGDWYLDQGTSTLYYWPRTADVAAALIVAPTVRDVFRVVGGSASTPAHNITIRGLEISVSDYVANFTAPQGSEEHRDGQEFESNKHGLIYLENAEHVTVTRNRLRNAGLSAVWLNKHAQHNTVASNWIESAGLNGVYLTGWDLGDGDFADPTEAYVSKLNTVTNNYITDVGKLAHDPTFSSIGCWRGSGIQLYQSGENLISHNTIRIGPRYGISQKGSRFGAMLPSYYGHAVTYENYKDFLYTRNNRIEFNDISEVMQRSTDGAGIESWGPGAGNVINNNRIHDLRAIVDWDNWFGAIYLDDGTGQTTVTNNIVYGVEGGSHTFLIMEKDVDNVIDNNVFTDNQAAWDFCLEPFAEPSYGLGLTRNIAANNGTSTVYIFATMPGGFRGNPIYTPPLTGPIPDRLASVDANLFFHSSGAYDVLESNSPTATAFDSWKSSHGGRYDEHSLTGADPQFIDPENRDYTVAPTSPALALGFRNIDQASIGLTSAFPFDIGTIAATSRALASAV